MAVCEHVPTHTRHLMANPGLEARVSCLSRKSWIHNVFEVAKMYCDHHIIAKDVDWTLEPDRNHSPMVIVHFGRSDREWSQGKADVECNAIIREIAGYASVITVTDGSYDPANNTAGWGFVAYQDDVKLAEALGSHIVYTSSTRMELEAIRQALLGLK